jgi:hypothetical protein
VGPSGAGAVLGPSRGGVGCELKRKYQKMSYPGKGPIYRNCLMCGVPFRVWHYLAHPNRGKFCSRECYYLSRRIYSVALSDERFESLFAPEREAARRARAARKMDDYTSCKIAADGRTHRHDKAREGRLT